MAASNVAPPNIAAVLERVEQMPELGGTPNCILYKWNGSPLTDCNHLFPTCPTLEDHSQLRYRFIKLCAAVNNRLNNAALSNSSTKPLDAVQISELRTEAINFIENITADDLQDNADNDAVTDSSDISSSNSNSPLFD